VEQKRADTKNVHISVKKQRKRNSFMPVFNDVLKPFVPEASFTVVSKWIQMYPLQIKITAARVSKLGDYRSPHGKSTFHKISINRSLNKYSFLITFAHEFAHLLCYVKHSNKVSPHGKQWKQIYKELIFELLESNIFPSEIEYELTRTVLGAVYASSTSEKELQKVLSEHNTQEETGVLLEELEENTKFTIHNARVFKKGKKIRTRYKCYCITNKRWYYVSPIARVIPIAE
jgi:SprT protein